MSSYPPKIVIEEQGLRDGLQTEKPFMPTDKKLEIIGVVADAGIKRIQVTSFVHPKLVPQMADAEEICKGLDWTRDVLYSGLVLNTKGLANALAAMQVGVAHFDTAFGGTGGCPFIKGATGNISTEDMVFMSEQMGIETGVDIDKVAAISRSLEEYFSKQFSGKMHRVIDRKDIQVVR
jgi:hydroxymethylglutaryl-CoA lyase